MIFLIFFIFFMFATPATTLAAEKLSEEFSAVEVVAITLWHEARGEGYDGIVAVASVIYNRAAAMNTPPLPEDFLRVCLKKKQFSCFNNGVKPAIIKTATDRKIWRVCVGISRQMVAGVFTPTHQYCYYYAHSKCKPKWAEKAKESMVVGNHTFLKLK